MTHTVEAAKSGRSKCRGCGKVIVKDDLRFGEQMENPFASDASMTLWFHVKCGALRRPASFSEVLRDELLTEMAAELEPFVTSGVAHHRLDRIAGVERAPSGRAKCRHCQETIAKDEWRIPLTFLKRVCSTVPGLCIWHAVRIILAPRCCWRDCNTFPRTWRQRK